MARQLLYPSATYGYQKKEYQEMNISVVDRTSSQKLKCQILTILREPIERGEWKVDMQIPTEEQLCERYGVSKTTVRSAIEELVALGYLSKLQGKGTFVRKAIPENGIRMAIHLNAERMEFSAVQRYHELENGMCKPEVEIADYLRLDSGEFCWHFARILVLDGLPLALEKLYVPARLCVTDLGVAANMLPLTSCVEGRCALKIQRLREKTDLPGADEQDVAFLRISPRVPVLRIRQFFYGTGGLPVGFASTMRRIDRFGRILEFERL
jgi:GntR family transcriptional regulator